MSLVNDSHEKNAVLKLHLPTECSEALNTSCEIGIRSVAQLLMHFCT